MENNEYQRLARRTASPDLELKQALTIGGLGIAGEAGEVADHIKKIVFHQHDLNKAKLAEEMGDVLWYIALLCDTLDISIGDVMAANIQKLSARYPEGFSSDRSRNRAEYSEEPGEGEHDSGV
jgi:NTP pyrophosphatase (non-canonical NTP hydrolase)